MNVRPLTMQHRHIAIWGPRIAPPAPRHECRSVTLPRRASLLLAAALAVMICSTPARAGVLRVCADPDYLPFSNSAGQGFENRAAKLLGKYLGDKVEYTWASYRGHGGFEEFLARTLNAGKCDVVMSMPYGSGEAHTTTPYYISSYVFVFKKSKHYDIGSMDSPVLREVRIGFEEGTPPADGLKLRGLITGAVGFKVGSDPTQSPKALLDAVRDGRTDVMITWEPAISGFLAHYPELEVVAVPNERVTGSPERYSFAMSMAVRPGDTVLGDRIDAVFAKHGAEFKSLLLRQGVRLYTPRNFETP